MESPVVGAHHVGVTVTDLERSIAFYQSLFGFAVSARFSVSGEAFETAVAVPDARADFAHLDADGIRLELVSYTPSGADRLDSQLNDAGAVHIGFSVTDLDRFYTELPADVEPLSEPQTTETGTSILFLRDPDGTLIEVLETE
ncbi:VOC family protein [Natronocalculus amylovorans]|uniref:VOC family protein n=1 Tax=Natronocalculus amylovorans TaxID=2917812 RepID=A0AAE3FVM7_9EURY|nr:VOC family protein [Natronocalculus amylovorans]MCL9816174.1 VOC family protein [Natronocalculus amylovorans]NUE03273.1 VOC family protein [Halorubraceae archaeon YAN]